MEHEMGGSGLMNPPNARRWHWLPISPDDNPLQWAHADIWERYPLPGLTPTLQLARPRNSPPPPTPRPQFWGPQHFLPCMHTLVDCTAFCLLWLE